MPRGWPRHRLAFRGTPSHLNLGPAVLRHLYGADAICLFNSNPFRKIFRLGIYALAIAHSRSRDSETIGEEDFILEPDVVRSRHGSGNVRRSSHVACVANYFSRPAARTDHGAVATCKELSLSVWRSISQKFSFDIR